MKTRVYERIYALPVILKAGKTIGPTNNLFLPSAPFLQTFKVDAIDINLNGASFINGVVWGFLTLLDSKKGIKLFNYPIEDLYNRAAIGTTPDVNPPYRTRLFKIDGVQTDASYITAAGAGFSVLADTTLMYINFYKQV